MRKFSILTNDFERCFNCGGKAECIHHIYRGKNRKTSDREGFIVPLCHSCHNMGPGNIHDDREKLLVLMRMCQRIYEAQGHSRTEFIKLIGRNYL